MKLHSFIHALISILLYLLFTVIVYLLFALYEFKINAFYWSEISRALMTLLNFLALGFLIAHLAIKFYLPKK